jgi:hypothetical protein
MGFFIEKFIDILLGKCRKRTGRARGWTQLKLPVIARNADTGKKCSRNDMDKDLR